MSSAPSGGWCWQPGRWERGEAPASSLEFECLLPPPTPQNTVDHMTQVLCQVLYSLDLKSLPLEQMGHRARPRAHARPSSRQGESPSQPDREVGPPSSPSARMVGRRLSFRRPRHSQVEHPVWRAPVLSPALAKVTSTSENILDQSFDIPSPTFSIPCESVSTASFKDKSTIEVVNGMGN